MFLSALTPTLALAPAAAKAAQESIAAVVNDAVISKSDVQARLQLGIVASNLPATDEILDRLRPQVLKILVDETIQMQEARRLGISVDDAQVKESFTRIAGQNGFNEEQFRQELQKKNIPLKTMEDQLRAQIAWAQVVRRQLRARVSVTESDIDAIIEQMENNAGKPEYLVSEIFLGVATPQDERRVEELAARLVEQVAKGAPFPAVARQFSEAPGAAGGGDLGWIHAGELPEELDTVLRQMQPGQISKPVRGLAGFHILLVRETRQARGLPGNEMLYDLKQVFLPLEGADDARRAEARKIAEDISSGTQNCDAMESLLEKYPSPLTGSLEGIGLRDMPPPVQEAVRDLAEGKTTPALEFDNGVSVLMVCGRKMMASNTESVRESIANQLGSDRLDLLQQRYLRDLRSAAFVDIRS